MERIQSAGIIMKLVVISITALAVFTCVQGEDECMPPKPGDKHVHAGECCKLKEEILTDEVKSIARNCIEKLPHPPKHHRPENADGFKEMKNYHACFVECFFEGSKLLTNDKKIDESAFKTFSVSSTKNDALKAVVEEATNTCLSSYKNKLDQSMNCTSGAMELQKCVSYEIFMNCPESMWTSSAECEERKAVAKRCPDQPIMMGGPHQHPPPPPH